MTFEDVVQRAFFASEKGVETTVNHPQLPWPIRVNRDGTVKFGFFSVPFKIGDFNDDQWSCE